MIRIILILILFTLSLVNYFPVPSKETWYAGIAVSEFPWIFMLAALLLLVWSFFAKRFKAVCIIAGTITFISLSYPVINAYTIGTHLEKDLQSSFGVSTKDIQGFHLAKPFSFIQMLTGNGAKTIPFTTFTIPGTATANPDTIPWNSTARRHSSAASTMA